MPAPRSSRPTQRDIAELAGVSITTVSHVVNDTRAVAPETRTAVLAAIETTGYTGDAIARSLVTGGTESIGVAVSLLAPSYFAALLHGIDRAAAEAGYAIVLANTGDTTEGEHRTIRALRARRVDGVVLTPASNDRGVADELLAAALPTVLVDRLSTRNDLDQVGAENIQAMSTLTEHLAEHGHRRIALLGGPAELSTSDERILGYRLGLGRGGRTWQPQLVTTGDSAVDGATAVGALLDLAEPPTAFLASNDAMAAGALQELRRRDIRIGDQVALACYDDPDWAELVNPPLTAIAQPVAEIGERAVNLLLARIREPSSATETIRLTPRLRVRESCGCRA